MRWFVAVPKPAGRGDVEQGTLMRAKTEDEAWFRVASAFPKEHEEGLVTLTEFAPSEEATKLMVEFAMYFWERLGMRNEEAGLEKMFRVLLERDTEKLWALYAEFGIKTPAVEDLECKHL